MKVYNNLLKQSLLAIGLLFTAVQLEAQEVLSVDSKLESLSIYSNGASMYHKTSATNIPKGTSELVINQISRNLSPESIRILSKNDKIQIQSVSFERDYIVSDKNKSSTYLALKKQYDSEKEVLISKTNARLSEESTLSMLEANKQIGGTNGATQASLTNMLVFYRKEHKKISDAISILKEEEKKQLEVVNKLKSQLEESGGEHTDAGQIVLVVHTDTPVQTSFEIEYYTYGVNWSPSYEIRVNDLEKPIKLVYNANLSQSTGIDWIGVALTFSNGNPNVNNNLPYLSTWWLSYEQMRPSPPAAPRLAKMSNAMMYDSQEVLEETVITAYGSARSSVQTSQLHTSFIVAAPYDVYTDKKALSIELQNYELPASYTYFSVPSQRETAFLIAKVSDWEQYNLLPGDAQLIVDQQYAGKSYIDPRTTTDTLEISLGQDPRIITKRKRIDEKGSKSSFLGNTQKRIYTYEIELKNTRNETANMEIKEMIPVSTEKDILVKLEQSSSARVNSEKGELTWELELKPNETKKLIVSYSITSAKAKRLSGI